MQRYRPLIFFGIALVIASFMSLMVFAWIREQAKGYAQPLLSSSTMVAVASAELPWGTRLTSEQVKLVPYPNGSEPEGHFTNLEALQGRVLLANVKHQEPILNSKLTPMPGAGGVAAVTDPKKRAMGVRVDDVVGIAGFIKPGDRVDVMVTIEPAASAGRVIAKMMLENIKVLASGTEMVRAAKDQEAKPVQVITLEVDVEEAEKLALASTQGKLRLALRNPLNADPVLTRGATVGTLLSSYRPKEVPREESDDIVSRDQVEVIKGGTLTKGGAKGPKGRP
jgi:pilus assembly protein CpaB